MDDGVFKWNETQKVFLFFFQNLIDLESVFVEFFEDYLGPF